MSGSSGRRSVMSSYITRFTPPGEVRRVREMGGRPFGYNRVPLPRGRMVVAKALPPRVSYSIDADDRIRGVDDAWLEFARLNDAPELTRAGVIGRSLWEFVTGAELRRLYGILVSRVRTDDTRIILPFRCDSPDERREMRLTISALRAGAVRFEGHLVSCRRRPWLAILHPGIPRSDLRVVICGICRRLRTPAGGWEELEDVVATMKLFSGPRPPSLDESICTPCLAAVSRLAADRRGTA